MSFENFRVRIEERFLYYSFRVNDHKEEEHCQSMISIGDIFDRLEVGSWVGVQTYDIPVASFQIKLNVNGSAIIQTSVMLGSIASRTDRYLLSPSDFALFRDTVQKWRSEQN
jgi:hypothetical protein